MSPDKPQAAATATAIAPLARPLTQCPYCEHESPPGSKFCNACGAALHLVPCPHCGAVNDITQTSACARCQGELLSAPLSSSALDLSPAEPPLLPSTRPMPPWPPEAATVLRPPRSRWLAGGAALAVLAVGGLYAFRPAPPPPPDAPAPPTQLVTTPAPVAVPVVAAPALAVAASAEVPAEVEPPPPAPAPAPAIVPPRVQRAQPAPAPLPEPVAPARAGAAEGLNPPSGPPPGPCTEARSALGLCSSSDRRP